MRTARVLVLWLVGGLIAGFLIWYLPSKLHPQYTAQTFIGVLPGSEKGSVVALIKHQSTLEALVDRDKVQNTGWFQRLGKTKDERMAGAVADLKKRLLAGTLPDSDLVTVSMTCDKGNEAAIIANEAVGIFLQKQLSAKRKQIASNLMFLEDQRTRIQRDLDLSEQECDNVRRRYGFSDLEQHSYADPVISRLIDLQQRTDNCALEKKEVQLLLEDFNTQTQPTSAEKAEVQPIAEVKELQAKLRMLQSRFVELQAMREEAEKQHNELNLAKAQYSARQKIRDERRRALDSIKSRVEELKILYDDPDSCGLQIVDDAIDPRQADMRPWQAVIPTAAAAAFIAGIGHILLTRRASKVS